MYRQLRSKEFSGDKYLSIWLQPRDLSLEIEWNAGGSSILIGCERLHVGTSFTKFKAEIGNAKGWIPTPILDAGVQSPVQNE